MTQQIKGAIEKIGREKNHEEFCGKHILGSLFREIYSGKLTQEYLFRNTYSGILTQEYLFRNTYSGILIQKYLFTKYLFTKTIGHVQSLRKWSVDVLNSIFSK